MAAGVTAEEVLATFRAMARLQAEAGARTPATAMSISFTTSPDDVHRVLDLARARGGG